MTPYSHVLFLGVNMVNPAWARSQVARDVYFAFVPHNEGEQFLILIDLGKSFSIEPKF
jgi:hypothetical protein